MSMKDVFLQSAYTNNKGTDLEGYYALKAIQAYIDADLPVPKKFIPYLVRAQTALNTANKTGKIATQHNKAGMVWEVKMLMNAGELKRDAIETVAHRNNVAVTTLEGWYQGTAFKDAKDDADMMSTGNSPTFR